MLADLELFMIERGTLFGKGVLERRWSGSILKGQAAVRTASLRHTVDAVIAEAKEQPTRAPVLPHDTDPGARSDSRAQFSLPHRHSDCCELNHCQSVERPLTAHVYLMPNA